MKKYLQFVGALIILLAAGYIFLVHTVMPKYIKQAIPQMQQLAAEYINGSVSIGGLKWEGGLTAELTDVVVKDARVRRCRAAAYCAYAAPMAGNAEA